MLPSPQPHKTTPNSDSNGYNLGTTIITEQAPPQQEAELDFNKLHSLDRDAENLVKDEQEQKAEPGLDPGARLSTNQTTGHHLWQRLSLKTRATALAIALGTLPVLMVGATAYYFANQSITKQIAQSYERAAIDLEDKLEIFISGRYTDIQAMADLDIFTNSRVRSRTTRQEKDAELNRFLEAYGGIYDSIAVFALNGDVLAQTKGKALPNHSDLFYFQTVLKTNRPFISEPQISKFSGNFVIYTAAPVKDTVTGKTVAIIRARMLVDSLNKAFDAYEEQEQEFYLVDSAGKIFLSEHKSFLDHTLKEELPNLAARIQAAGDVETFTAKDYDDEDNQEVWAAYAPSEDLREAPYNLSWGAIITTPTDIAFAPQRQLLLTLLLGTGIAAVLISAIAAYLANQATRPILAATSAVQKLRQGELDTRIAVEGADELAMLGSNINLMADKIQTLLQRQAAEAERARIIKDITVRLGQFPQVEEIFDTAVQDIRLALKSDRVVVYGFNENWQGTVIAESVAEGWPPALGAEIDDPCFANKYVEWYRQGRVQATGNIYEAGLTGCYLKQLEQFAVKANLVAPILQGGQLLGLLIAHQCDSPRAWQQFEIDLFAQLAVQVGYALDRVNLLEQQKKAKEQLQARAMELMMEVEPVSKGDLTIRASVTADEIGTLADSYNATVASLRKIVTQVQAAAKQVATTTSSSSGSVQELSKEALRQAQEIAVALDRIQEMSNSIRAVAADAEQAEAAVQLAAQRVKDGDAAMNRTVEGIMAIRETVAETSTKVKRLGEASQKISKVVNLINSFADQTNLLALNAAIEAARAGEQGLGFAVVADEVGTLARQSAEATAEIASLVKDIQTGTNEVVAAMEAGTLQVAEGTKLVDETRQSLNQITATSAQISALVTAIASSTVTQSQASEAVSQTITDVAAIALKTSNESTVVSASFQELLALATELQASAGQFKVS